MSTYIPLPFDFLLFFFFLSPTASMLCLWPLKQRRMDREKRKVWRTGENGPWHTGAAVAAADAWGLLPGDRPPRSAVEVGSQRNSSCPSLSILRVDASFVNNNTRDLSHVQYFVGLYSIVYWSKFPIRLYVIEYDSSAFFLFDGFGQGFLFCSRAMPTQVNVTTF